MAKKDLLISIILTCVVIFGWLIYPKRIASGMFTLTSSGGVECRCIGIPKKFITGFDFSGILSLPPECFGWRFGCKEWSHAD